MNNFGILLDESLCTTTYLLRWCWWSSRWRWLRFSWGRLLFGGHRWYFWWCGGRLGGSGSCRFWRRSSGWLRCCGCGWCLCWCFGRCLCWFWLGGSGGGCSSCCCGWFCRCWWSYIGKVNEINCDTLAWNSTTQCQLLKYLLWPLFVVAYTILAIPHGSSI